MTPSDEPHDADLDANPEPRPDREEPEGQVSEAAGAFNDDETALAGADAIPDKTTGTATGNR